MNLKRIFDSLPSTSWVFDVIDPKTAQAINSLVNSYFEPEQLSLKDNGLSVELSVALPFDKSLIPNLRKFANSLNGISSAGVNFSVFKSNFFNPSIKLFFKFGKRGEERWYREGENFTKELNSELDEIETMDTPEEHSRALSKEVSRELSSAKRLIASKLRRAGIKAVNACRKYPLYLGNGELPTISGYNYDYGEIVVKPISELRHFAAPIYDIDLESPSLAGWKNYDWFVSYQSDSA